MSLSSTRRPSMVPRKLLNTDSTRSRARRWRGATRRGPDGGRRRRGAGRAGGQSAGSCDDTARAAWISSNTVGSARNSRRASSAAVRRSSAASDDWVFDAHHASPSSISSGRRRASRSATSASALRMGGESTDATDSPRPSSVGSLRGRGGEHRTGLASEWFVDHLALERDRCLAAGDGVVERREQPLAPGRSPRVTTRTPGWPAPPARGGCTACRDNRASVPRLRRAGTAPRRRAS